MGDKMNIVKLLGITYKEDIISNLIVGLINESKAFRNSFIRNILNIENPSDFKVRLYKNSNISWYSRYNCNIRK